MYVYSFVYKEIQIDKHFIERIAHASGDLILWHVMSLPCIRVESFEAALFQKQTAHFVQLFCFSLYSKQKLFLKTVWIYTHTQMYKQYTHILYSMLYKL